MGLATPARRATPTRRCRSHGPRPAVRPGRSLHLHREGPGPVRCVDESHGADRLSPGPGVEGEQVQARSLAPPTRSGHARGHEVRRISGSHQRLASTHRSPPDGPHEEREQRPPRVVREVGGDGEPVTGHNHVSRIERGHLEGDDPGAARPSGAVPDVGGGVYQHSRRRVPVRDREIVSAVDAPRHLAHDGVAVSVGHRCCFGRPAHPPGTAPPRAPVQRHPTTTEAGATAGPRPAGLGGSRHIRRFVRRLDSGARSALNGHARSSDVDRGIIVCRRVRVRLVPSCQSRRPPRHDAREHGDKREPERHEPSARSGRVRRRASRSAIPGTLATSVRNGAAAHPRHSATNAATAPTNATPASASTQAR